MRRLTGLLLGGILLFYSVFFFVNDFGLIDIQKSAIVLGVGIDREEEGYRITAQLAVPQNSDQGKKTSSVEVTGVGKTVGDALTVINSTTGWYPKLTFLGLIVLGESLSSMDCFAALDFFLKNENVSDHAMVVATDTSAKEFLSARTPTEDIGTLAVEKVLSREGLLSGAVLPMNLREFAIGYYSKGRSGHLPLIKKVEEGEKALFDGTETGLYEGGKQVAVLSSKETLVSSLLLSPIRIVTYPVVQGGISFTLGLKSAKVKKEVTKEDGRYKLAISLALKASTLDSDAGESLKDIARTEDVKAEILKAANEQISERLFSVLQKTMEVKSDLFSLRSAIQKKFPKDELGEEFFDWVDLSISVDVTKL